MTWWMTVASLAIGFFFGWAIRRGRENPYGAWLDRECWVRPAGRENTWRRHVVTAVSHHGSICVRLAAEPNKKGYWIKKDNVPLRVRFGAVNEGKKEG